MLSSLPLHIDIEEYALGDANVFLQTPKIISMAEKLKLIHVLFSLPSFFFLAKTVLMYEG